MAPSLWFFISSWPGQLQVVFLGLATVSSVQSIRILVQGSTYPDLNSRARYRAICYRLSNKAIEDCKGLSESFYVHGDLTGSLSGSFQTSGALVEILNSRARITRTPTERYPSF